MADVKLSALRVGLEGDATSYKKMADDKVAADQKMIASGAAVVTQTDRVAQASTRGFESLKRQYLEGYGAAQSLETGLTRVQKGLDVGALSAVQAAEVTTKLTAKYGEVTGAAGAFGLISGKVTDSIGAFTASSGLAGAVLSKFGAYGAIAAAGLGVLVESFSALKAAANVERQQATFNAVIKATGDAAGITAQTVNNLAAEMSKSTFATIVEVRSAATELAAFANITGTNFARTIEVADDLTAVIGGDLQSNVLKLAKILEEPEQGVQRLTKANIILSQATKDAIKSMAAQGDMAGAQSRLLKELEDRYGGAAAAGHAGLSGALDEASKAQTAFNLAIGQSPLLQATATAAVSLYTEAIKLFTPSGFDAAARFAAAHNEAGFEQRRGGVLSSITAGSLATAQAGGDQKAATDEILVSLQRKIDLTKLDADTVSVATAREKAFNDVINANKNVAAAGGDEALRRQAIAAADLAEKEVRITAALRERATAEATAQQGREAALAQEIRGADAIGIEIEDIKEQIYQGTLSDRDRAIRVNVLKAEKIAREDDVGSIAGETAAIVTQTGILFDQEVARKKAADAAKLSTDEQKSMNRELGSFATQTFDRVGAAITTAFVQGGKASVTFGTIVQGVFSEITQEMLKLGIMNPLKNALGLTAGNNGVPFPTFGSAGGLFDSISGLFAGPIASFAASDVGVLGGTVAEDLLAGVIALADGGIMTSRGPLPLNSYAGGGIANSPQLAMFGEGRRPEAYVPLPDGRRIPVAMQGGPAANGGGDTTNHYYTIDARGSTNPAETAQLIEQVLNRKIPGIVKTAADTVQQARLRTPHYFGGGG